MCQASNKLFNKSIDDLLSKIGSELYYNHLENINGISYEQFIEDFKQKETYKTYDYPNKIVVAEPENRCYCRVWLHVKKEYRQCRRNKVLGSNYCKKHLNKRNYGEIK